MVTRLARPKNVTKEEKERKIVREIDTLMADILKKHGKDRSEGFNVKQPHRISTGIFSLDLALCGGIPLGRVTQYNGRKHSGKTTGAELVIAQAQRQYPDQEHVFVDIEGTRDATWGLALGVDNDKLNLVQNSVGEQTVDIIEALVRTKEVGLIVVDSIAALTPMHEIEQSAEDNKRVGGNSGLITMFSRKVGMALLAERARDHWVTLLVINQDRVKIGGWSPGGGEAIGHPGGKAWEHLQSVDVRFSNHSKVSKDALGLETAEYNEHSFKIEKCKMNGGTTKGDYQLLRRDVDEFRQEGMIDDSTAILAHAKRVGLYGGGGKGWTLKFGDYEEKYANAEECITVLNENPDFRWELRTHLIADHAARLKMDPEFIEYIMKGV